MIETHVNAAAQHLPQSKIYQLIQIQLGKVAICQWPAYKNDKTKSVGCKALDKVHIDLFFMVKNMYIQVQQPNQKRNKECHCEAIFT